jgi:hypothetical protein
MGLLDFLKPKKEEAKTEGKKTEKPESKEPETEEETGFNEPCALCGKAGTDKKWAGQYWHKKCLRAARKGAKGMI